MTAKLQRRLATIEAQVAEIDRRAKLANCTCHEITLAVIFDNEMGVESLKKLINLRCPCHGLRRLDKMKSIIQFVGQKGEDCSNPELYRLIEGHNARVLEEDRKRERDQDDA